MWPLIAGLAGEAVGALFGSHSASQANQRNIKLSREQRAWETQMSNTAVQRRADDIRLAGGNPALAFTGGQSASTPSVSAPSVEPTFRPEWVKGTASQAVMMKAQLENLKANTVNTAAQARKTLVDAENAEKYGRGETGLGAMKWQQEWAKTGQSTLKTEIMRNQSFSSAAEREVKERTVDALVSQAVTKARTGELNLESLEKFMQTFGPGAKDNMQIIGQIFTILRHMFGAN